MTANRKSAAGLILMMIICLFAYCGYLFFEAVVSLCLLYICSKSLYGLFMYNFATDDALLRYEQNLALNAGLFPQDIFLTRLKNISFYLLFIIYFSGEIVFAESFIIKVLSLAALMLWIFDCAKTIFGYIKKYDIAEWGIKEGVFEALMWTQIILSLILAIFKLVTV